jgi:hypothetical protein
MDANTLILYCDLIPDSTLLDPKHSYTPFRIRNCFLGQHILDFETKDLDKTNFTVSPQLEVSTLELSARPWQVRLFSQGPLSGKDSMVIIGLMGGWTPDKLENTWYWLNGPERRFALKDPRCKIVFDYSLEGFTELVFPYFWNWIYEHGLEDKVVYVSSSINVSASYKEWCRINGLAPNMTCLWSGFFAKNIYSSLPMSIYQEGRKHDNNYKLQHPLEHNNIINELNQQMTRYRYDPLTDARIMCLNRRPHIHRLLLVIMLKRQGVLKSMAVSFPKDFEEPHQWMPPNYDKMKRQWSVLRGHMHGYADHLENDFHDLYNNILPLTVDRSDFETNHAHDLNISMYRRHPVNLITETLAFDSSVFFSEKIWKPMLMKQIFLLWAAPQYLNWMRSLGFKTFTPYINEDYDTITDDMCRAEALAQECKRLVALDQKEFDRIVGLCQPIMEHNQRLVTSRSFMVETSQREVIKYIKNLGKNT